MASYTTHYGLHQWVPEDDFLRTDFNEDLEKIDTALGEICEAADGKATIITGTYTGDDTEERLISLGFQPKALLLARNTGTMGTTGGSYPTVYGGLVLWGMPVQSGTRIALSLSSTGFTVYNYSDFSYIRTNLSKEIYHYLAIR